ncbi:MAG: glycosyltransferase family 4 protein [Patescibacteria group bacterium]
MKTLLLTLEYPPFKGGVANYYENLVKHWPQPDKIFVLKNDGNSLINNRIWPKWLPALFKLKEEIKEKKINNILVGQILPLGTVALLVSKFKKIEYSVIIHGLDFSLALRNARKRWLTKKILSGSKNIICGNSYTAELVKNFLGEDKKIITVNPGVNNIAANPETIKKIKEKYSLKDKSIILTIGRIIKRKGIDTTLKSLPEVFKKIPNLIYVIAGSGSEEENIKKIIADLNLEKNVLTIKNITDEGKNAWYEICDIFIMPARNINGDYEGFGIVYLEANLAGKPVIAGKSGGVGDAVIDGKNGLLVDPKNYEEISTAIFDLIKNEDKRKKLGEWGRERAIKDFNWTKQIKKIYNSIK